MAFNRETVNDQQLHLAALQGSVEGIKRVMATGKITVSKVDQSVDNAETFHEDFLIHPIIK